MRTFNYAEREEHAIKAQQVDKIAKALESAGIERVTIEQTGGFCMVVYVWNKDYTKAICLVSWGVIFVSDTEKHEEEHETDLSQDYGVQEGEELTAENLAELVAIVKENLYRLED